MLVKVIFIILLVSFSYTVGTDNGEKRALTRIRDYIKQSKDWNEFMEKISADFNENNIEVRDETTRTR